MLLKIDLKMKHQQQKLGYPEVHQSPLYPQYHLQAAVYFSMHQPIYPDKIQGILKSLDLHILQHVPVFTAHLEPLHLLIHTLQTANSSW